MRTLLYIFISVALFFRSILYIFYYLNMKRRKSDIYSAFGFILLSAFSLYLGLFLIPCGTFFEVIIVSMLGIIAIMATLFAYLKALKVVKR